MSKETRYMYEEGREGKSDNQSYHNVKGCGKEFKLNITHPTKHRCGNLLFCDTCLYNKGSDKKCNSCIITECAFNCDCQCHEQFKGSDKKEVKQ